MERNKVGRGGIQESQSSQFKGGATVQNEAYERDLVQS